MDTWTFDQDRTSPCAVEGALVHESVDAHPFVSIGGDFHSGILGFHCFWSRT